MRIVDFSKVNKNIIYREGGEEEGAEEKVYLIVMKLDGGKGDLAATLASDPISAMIAAKGACMKVYMVMELFPLLDTLLEAWMERMQVDVQNGEV